MNGAKKLSSRLSAQFGSSYGFSQGESTNGGNISESTSYSATAGANLKITNQISSGYNLFIRNSESITPSTVTGLSHSTAVGTNVSFGYGQQFFKLLNFSNSLSGAISKTKTATSGLAESESKTETLSNSGSLDLDREILRIINVAASGGYSVTKGNQADITPEKANLDMDRDSKSHNYSLNLHNKILEEYISIVGNYIFTTDRQVSSDQNGDFFSENKDKTYSLDIGLPYFTSFFVNGNYSRRQSSNLNSDSEEDSQDYKANFGFNRDLLGGAFSSNANYMKRQIKAYTSENLATTINYSRSLTRFMFGNFYIVRNDSWSLGANNTSTSYRSRITYQLRRWSIGFNYDYSISQDIKGNKDEQTYMFANITRFFSRTFY
jgi:hypothetical protein